MDQFLEKFFDSVPKARVLRFFMQNTSEFFALNEIAQRTQIKKRHAKKEIDKLLKLRVITGKIVQVKNKKAESRSDLPVGKSTTGSKKIVSKKIEVFGANTSFQFFGELRDLVSHSSVASKGRLLKQIRGFGGIKLAIISGVFLNQENSRIDLLLVGDNISRSKLNIFLGHLESELGRSLQYTLMETDEFKYRLGMYDRFLRDILEYPHQKLINKLGI